MTTRNLFKLAVRLLGLVFLYHGLVIFPVVLPGLVQNVGGLFGSFMFNLLSQFLMVGWPLGVAFCLLMYAPAITDYFYPKSED